VLSTTQLCCFFYIILYFMCKSCDVKLKICKI